MKELCVVHLVRTGNSIESLKGFLDSYHVNPGEIEHDLLIVFKGFQQREEMSIYRELLAPFRHLELDIPDEGFDITAYLNAVNRYSDQYRYFCFVNSHSVILDPGWLRKLYEGVTQPGVGLAGATGSWLSKRTDAISWFRALPGFVAQLFQTGFGPNSEIVTPDAMSSSAKNTLGAKLFRFVNHFRNNMANILYYPPFPNHHIRTNAFIISGDLMRSIRFPPLKKKADAYRFESGNNGLTLQASSKAPRVVVVGRDGQIYEKETWPQSNTFWNSNQENLLVADNQTRDYQDGTPERRSYLASMAWGRDLSVTRGE